MATKIREVIDFQMAKSADQNYRVRKTKMATGNQCVGVLKEHIARSIREVMSVLHAGNLRHDEMDYLYYKIDRIEHILALSSQVVDIESSVAQCVRDAKELIANELDRVSNRSDQGYHTEQASSGNRGRPRYDIQQAQLQFFVRFGFSVSEMAKMLAVSQATVNRRLRDYGISLSTKFCQMSDSELDELMKDVKEHFPRSGYRVMLGILRSMGYHIQEWRVRESLRRVDIEGVVMRSLQLQILHRRRYSVYGPNALWHVDTNHKLIRYVYNLVLSWCTGSQGNNHFFSLFRSHWLAVVYCFVLCSGYGEPVHEDITYNVILNSS